MPWMQGSYPNEKLGARKGMRGCVSAHEGPPRWSGERSRVLAGLGLPAASEENGLLGLQATHSLGTPRGGGFPEGSQPSQLLQEMGATPSCVELAQGSRNPALPLENVSAALRGPPSASGLPT